MEVRFESEYLQRLETEKEPKTRIPPPIVTAFRKKMQIIRAARDERDFYAMKSLRFEKLEGKRKGEHSMRLNEQYRLVCFLEGEAPGKVLVLVSIEDYH